MYPHNIFSCHIFFDGSYSWGPGSCFGHLFNGILDEKHVVEYFDNLPKALATLDTVSVQINTL
jgi:hypothetical protein